MLGLRPGLLSDCLGNAKPLNKLKKVSKASPQNGNIARNGITTITWIFTVNLERKERNKETSSKTDQNEGYSIC